MALLPALDVVGPDGCRTSIRSVGRNDTARVLSEAFGVDELIVDGRVVAPDTRLVDVDELRFGATISVAASEGPADAGSHVVEYAVVAGPACGSWRRLSAGRHLIGRAAHTSITIDDPAIEPHHALLVVDGDGEMTFTQLSGAVPARFERRPDGGRVSLGTTVIDVRHAPEPDRRADSTNGRGSIAAHTSDPWRRVVWRAPFRHPAWHATRPVLPAAATEPSPPSATGLIGAGIAAVGAFAIAVVLGNPMFLVFAGVGALATAATWGVSTGVSHRARRRVRADARARLGDFRDQLVTLRSARSAHHTAAHPGVVDTLDELAGARTRIWRDRTGDLVATLGTGTVRWTPEVDAGACDESEPDLAASIVACGLFDGPATITIGHGDVVGLQGPADLAAAVARAIIVQLATWTGPADWRLIVVTDRPARWAWADWLPHHGLQSGCVVSSIDPERLGGELASSIDGGGRTLVVTDVPRLFTARTGPLRRFLGASGAAALVVTGVDDTVPAMCRRVLTIGATGRASWSGDVPTDDDAVAIAIAGVSVDSADAAARRLACLVDPEVDVGSGAGVPESVTFADLALGEPVSAATIAARWRGGGPDPAPSAPIGWSADGLVDVDLVRDGPHGLIAGTTGSGKSELLRSLVLSLAASVDPRHLNFVLVDYKGGSTFDACVRLPHTVGVVTDLDGGLAERALRSLDAELHRRERLLRNVGATDLTDYRAREPTEDRVPIARLVVVIDEFAALAKELPDFLAALVGIAQRGRSLGVHLLLATQRPAGVVSDDIRANTNLRLALRLNDRSDAVDVVGDALPSGFPRAAAGRAALRLGPDELIVFQAARCTGPLVASSIDRRLVIDRRDDGLDDATVEERHERSPTELDVVAEAIMEAARMTGLDAPHRPWIEPLPHPLRLADDERGIGVVDDPEHQARRPLAWWPGDGNLSLVGSIGSGTTSTLISIASSICRDRSPDDVHLYVLDARGDDGLGALAALAHCGGVVRVTEHERVHRVLARVVSTIDDRLSGFVEHGPNAVVVMIDGFATLRSSLTPVERTDTHDLLQRLLRDGPAVGVTTVFTDDGGASSATIAVGDRWVFHVDDPAVARGVGLRSSPIPAGLPGRLRIASSGLEAQVALGALGLAAIATRDECAGGPEPVAALPERVLVDDGDQWTSSRDDRGVGLVVGLGAADLVPDRIEVPNGDHLLVVGAARTGVSTALRRCVAAWCQALETGAGSVVTVDRHHPLDPEALSRPDRPILVVVDDAHRVDDAGGLLAAIAGGAHPHVTLMVGARADAVRTAYGHWTREVAKCRCGLVMTSRGDPDGDVLGATIPRRALILPRPGLAWIVDGRSLRQVQVGVKLGE